MSIPEYPINPTEQYLNRMVTGEGELPPHPMPAPPSVPVARTY